MADTPLAPTGSGTPLGIRGRLHQDDGNYQPPWWRRLLPPRYTLTATLLALVLEIAALGIGRFTSSSDSTLYWTPLFLALGAVVCALIALFAAFWERAGAAAKVVAFSLVAVTIILANAIAFVLEFNRNTDL